jgi:hypothetical protein
MKNIFLLLEGPRLILPAIDVQLMNEHLTTHEGVLYKLRIYYHHVQHPTLKQIIHKQYMVMEDHVRVMLRLMDPNRTEWVYLAHIDLNIVPDSPKSQDSYIHSQDKPIAIEASATAKSMANTNFMSSLMMKNPNVKSVHLEMAIQQAKLKDSYSKFIQNEWPEKPTMSSKETQLEIINEFVHLLP